MVEPTQELSEHYRSVRGYLAHVLTHISFEAGPAGRPLALPPDPQPILDSLAVELDKTYREVARWLPDNPDVRFEKVKGKEELILTPLDALDEPPSLIQLRKVVPERLPRVELRDETLASCRFERRDLCHSAHKE